MPGMALDVVDARLERQWPLTVPESAQNMHRQAPGLRCGQVLDPSGPLLAHRLPATLQLWLLPRYAPWFLSSSGNSFR